ncbi:MAG: hypothetical protein GX787_04125 [Tissierellia bacterium]|jgi:hypothetical protein|nr:hypothetical protein [Tissierellia bacterium]
MADIEAENGVIHVIDKVLVPSNFTLKTMEENTEMPKTGVIELTTIITLSIISLAAAFVLKKRIFG